MTLTPDPFSFLPKNFPVFACKLPFYYQLFFMCNKHSSLTAKIRNQRINSISYIVLFQLVLDFLNSYFRHMLLKGGKFLLALGIFFDLK